MKNHLPYFCRNEATRTPDPYVPNVVRYQLRYIPIIYVEKVVSPGIEPGTDTICFCLIAGAKENLFFDNTKLFLEKSIKKVPLVWEAP